MIIMDLGTKNANSLISKDKKLAADAAQCVVNGKDIETFKKLCDNSEFIFDFLKEKIIKNLTDAVNENNIVNIKEFAKIHCYDFEDFIIKSWLKFANEELTDELLEIFESGTKEQKTYAAKYFYHINDPLCLEYLNQYALDDYEPLAYNCAVALKKFKDKNLYKKAIDFIQDDSYDEFQKFPYINFLISYNDKSAFDTLYNYMIDSPAEDIISSGILSLKSFDDMIKDKQTDEAKRIFDNITGAYPETLSLSTIDEYDVYDFIKYLYANKDSYSKRLLLKAKHKFNAVTKEDIYTYDLDKDTKQSLHKINEFLNTLNLDYDIKDEFYSKNSKRIIEAIDVIENFALEDYGDFLASYALNEELNPLILTEIARVLKSLNRIHLIKKDDFIRKFKDENIKMLFESYFI